MLAQVRQRISPGPPGQGLHTPTRRAEPAALTRRFAIGYAQRALSIRHAHHHVHHFHHGRGPVGAA